MTARDLLGMAAVALWRHRRRSGLSLLGMAIGIAAVLVLTALGEGARRYIEGQFESLGSRLVGVIPGHTETSGNLPGAYGGVPNDLTLDEIVRFYTKHPSAKLLRNYACKFISEWAINLDIAIPKMLDANM